MAIVVDTCSLVMIAKNYLPLDKDGCLFTFLKDAFYRRELLLLDAILEETKHTSQGIAVDKMPFLKDKKLAILTKDILPPSPRKFSNMMDNNFCVRLVKNELTEQEYVQQKAEYSMTADYKILVYSMKEQNLNGIIKDEYYVMTEETRLQNDGKLFKKLPLLCEQIGVETITSSAYLHGKGFFIDK